MANYYIRTVLNDISGPHTKDQIGLRARMNPSFWVSGESLSEWTPVDSLLEFFAPENLDGYGQPKDVNWNAARVMGRSLDELLGICKGIIADGVVHDKEATYLKNWFESNREVAQTWPANVLASRVQDIFNDGVVSDEEREELRDLLGKITGEVPGASDAEQHATKLPFDDPEPEIQFGSTTFCFTGKFLFGSRRKLEQAVYDKGSEVQINPTQDTDFLVVGAVGSRDWIHSTHGRKMEKVLKNKEDGAATAIVSEEHWTKFVR